MALDADALAALAHFGKSLPGGSEGEDRGEGESAHSSNEESGTVSEESSGSTPDASSGSIPPAWENFSGEPAVIACLLEAVAAETDCEQTDLLPDASLKTQLDFDDLSLYAVVARLEGELGEKRSDKQIAACKTLGELARLYQSH
ncbi:acyl carrier protein [Varibaculum cambriense]|uniref:acyl carrier protein n=1 Tax=Varibaculum cambriense TaxID=184870 RepID=UPI0025526A62|nr:acyl carrier protein [Varibaculum cambriense]MDK8275143.1 acyl carrier protein [Varibaculum cambriense]